VLSTLLAIEAARGGGRVLLVDADEAVGSLHMMLGITDPGPGLGALRGGRVEPEQLVVAAAPGLDLFPGGGGGMDATLSSAAAERRALLRRVAGMYEQYGTVVVDGGSRLDSVMAACSAGAERLLCVTSADRISMAASYALFKVARARFEALPVELVVNASEEREGRNLHATVRAATHSFLQTDVPLGAVIPRDDAVASGLEQGAPLTELPDESAARSAAGALAQRLAAERRSPSLAAGATVPLTRRL